jgi:TRAP transporter TAXI family solute receptor
MKFFLCNIRVEKIIKIFIIFLFLTSNGDVLFSQTLKMVTGDKGGNYHKGGEALKILAEKSGINIELINTDGAFQNIFEVGKNEANLGLVQIDVLAGLSNSSKETKKLANNCLAIAPTELEYVHIVVNNSSNIKTFSDLRAKKVSVGSTNSGTAYTANTILAFLIKGVNVTSPNFLNMDEEESLRRVVNGEIDAAFLTTTLNSTLLSQLGGEDTPIRLLALNTREIPIKIKEAYYTEIIPPNTYPWQKDAVEVPATASFLIVSKETDYKYVKKIVEILYDNEDHLDSESHLWSGNASKAFIQLKKLGIPYHPLVEKHLTIKKSGSKKK